MRKVFLVMAFISLSGCVSTGGLGPDIMPRQPGDKSMTCPQLEQELTHLDAYIDETEKSLAVAGYGNNALNRSAQRAARDVTEGQYSGYINDMFGMTREWEREQARTQSFQLRNARKRHRHLSRIFQQKKCL
jgi:hypothetical protein